MRQALYTRVLEQTATTLGGQDALAVLLNVAPSTVQKWMTGAAPIPLGAFLACVDHLLEWQFAHVRDLFSGETQGKGRSQGSSAAVLPSRREGEDLTRGE
jgi:hypothetical protein